MIPIMLLLIFLSNFRLIPCLLVGFLRLWPFNFHLSFTLYFPTLNLMDWHETKEIPSIGVLEHMFNILAQSEEAIQSYRPSSWLLAYPFVSVHVYKLHILTPWASFVLFSLGKCANSLGGREQTHLFEKKRI